jgi:protein-disulfide isomerase
MALKGTVGIALSAWLAGSSGLFGGTCQGQSQGSGQKDPSAAVPVDVSLPGVDTSALTPREKKEWSGYVSELLAPCSDTPVSIAQCVQEKRACSRCLPAAKFVLRGVRDGLSRDQIEKAYHGRFDADRVKNVPIDDSPVRGPSSAPITIVEFADFECPFCAIVAPQIEKTIDARPKGEVRYVFKFFPLSGHAHGELTARAGVAAQNQGKFWEMHDKMFANREHLEQSDLDAYAKELGLNLPKFHADMQSQATTDRIAKDKKLGETLELRGTPTIYINGRDYEPRQDLNEWLNLEIAGAPPSPSEPAPAASGSNAKALLKLDAGAQK